MARLRDGLRGLAFANPATWWTLLTEGPTNAVAYLRHVANVWPTRRSLALYSQPHPRIPLVPAETAFPEADFGAVELLYPLPSLHAVSSTELIILAAVTRAVQPARVLELGVAAGRTTINLALQAPAAEIIGIDLPPDHPKRAMGGSLPGPSDINPPGQLFANGQFGDRIRLVLQDLAEFDFASLANTVDLAFIDGHHDYESARRDTLGVLNTLRPGGWVFWHDYPRFDGVAEWLHELAAERQLTWLADTHLVVGRG